MAPEAFIIMQIGDADLDVVCDSAIVPALKCAGLDPRRVDRHNSGDLLKSEIVGFLERSEIIVADLTNERPNCYLEVGYAMGLGKKPNLILTARSDHLPDSPGHVAGGPKIHFDLSGYDILFWDADELDSFRAELERRIRRRRALLSPASAAVPPIDPWDRDWLQTEGDTARRGLFRLGKPGFLELNFALDPPKGGWPQQELLNAVRASNIPTFGWPIGIVIDRDPGRPRPTPDGIVAEIERSGGPDATYDYWSLKRNGDFFLLQNLFEDGRSVGVLFVDTRIARMTEALLFAGRLYNQLRVAPTTTLHVRAFHGGLIGRTLSVANRKRRVFESKATILPSAVSEVSFELDSLDARLVDLVVELLQPVFTLFDFTDVPREVYDDIVNGFVEGEVR